MPSVSTAMSRFARGADVTIAFGTACSSRNASSSCTPGSSSRLPRAALAKELLLAVGKRAQTAGVDVGRESADDRLVAQPKRLGEVVGRVWQRGFACELMPGGEVMRSAVDDDAVQVEQDGDVTPHAT